MVMSLVMAVTGFLNRFISRGIPDGVSPREVMARKIFNVDAISGILFPILLVIAFTVVGSADLIIYQLLCGICALFFAGTYFLVGRGFYNHMVLISLGLLFLTLVIPSLFMDSPINPLFLLPVGINSLIYLPEKKRLSRAIFLIFVGTGTILFLLKVSGWLSDPPADAVWKSLMVAITTFTLVLVYKIFSLLLVFQISISQNQRNKMQLESVLNSNFRYQVISLDANYRLITSNQNFAEQIREEFGIELKNGIDLQKVLHPLRDTLLPWIDRAIKGEEHTQYWSFRRRKGQEAHFELNFYPLLTPEGTNQGCSIFIADITAERIAAQHAWLREKIVLSMVQNYPAIYYCFDENLVFTESVGSGLKALGLEDNQMVGISIRDAYGDYPEIIANHERTLAGEFVSYVTPVMAGDREIHYDVKAFYDEKTKSGVGLAFDVTEIVEARKELLRQNEELTKANHELDSFVYKVTHDLRSPLTSLMGLIDLALDDEGARGASAYLELQKRAVLKMDQYVKQIVDFARNSRMEVITEKVDFDQLLNDCLGQYEEQAKERKVQFTHQVQQEDYYSDPARLKIILDNLVSNAIKYCDPTKSERMVDIQIARENGHIAIRCHDNGRGIPIEQQPKVFDMFYRAHKGALGSGLGLYMVKETVSKLQGKIDLNSSENEFTEFVIKLPA